MSIPVFTCFVLGAILIMGGSFIVFRGKKLFAGACNPSDVRALGLVHIIVGGWFLIGAATEDPNTTLGACLLMTKVKYCTTEY